jgi:regulator of protease activity HflC (stomatin/prohibitin superfamily)
MKGQRVLPLLVLILSLGSLPGCKVVEDGELGIKKSFGKISPKALQPGLHWNIFIANEVEKWDVKTQRRSIKLDIPSREGLMVRVEGTVLFKPKDVVKLRIGIGESYVSRVLDPAIIGAVREEIGRKRVEDLIIDQKGLVDSLEAVLKVTL